MNALQRPDIFDRQRRHDAYRSMTSKSEVPIFHQLIAENLIERLQIVTRNFERALLVNAVDPNLEQYLKNSGAEVVIANLANPDFEEDSPFFTRAEYDLVVIAWGLETINDLPGAFTLFRYAMRPDSLFLASFPGAGTYHQLRSSMQKAEMEETEQLTQRFHPQIDIRATGDLLQRTGFALPVIDVDVHTVKYKTVSKALTDIEDHGWANLLPQNTVQPDDAVMKHAEQDFIEVNGGLDKVQIITITAWSPGENQPKAAPRGSSTQSLASILNRFDPDGI